MSLLHTNRISIGALLISYRILKNPILHYINWRGQDLNKIGTIRIPSVPHNLKKTIEESDDRRPDRIYSHILKKKHIGRNGLDVGIGRSRLRSYGYRQRSEVYAIFEFT